MAVDRKGFTETAGDAIAYAVNGDKTDSLFLNMEGRVEGPLDNAKKWWSDLSLGWRHDLDNNTAGVTAQVGDAMVSGLMLTGRKLDRDRLFASAGIASHLTGSVIVSARYDGDIAGNYKRHQISLGLSAHF